MIPSPVSSQLKSEEKELLKIFRELDQHNKSHLMAFAAFLQSQYDNAGAPPKSELLQPEPLSRPENETVIKAIKRLSLSYSMLNKDNMLHETSDLMSAHVLKGRPAKDVIDELEALFEKHYENYKDSFTGQ